MEPDNGRHLRGRPKQLLTINIWLPHSFSGVYVYKWQSLVYHTKTRIPKQHSHLGIEIPPCACEKTQDHIQYPINHLGPWKNNGLTTGNTLAPSSNPKLYWRISTAYPHVSFSWVATTWSQMFFHQSLCKHTKIPCIPSIFWAIAIIPKPELSAFWVDSWNSPQAIARCPAMGKLSRIPHDFCQWFRQKADKSSKLQDFSSQKTADKIQSCSWPELRKYH